MAGSIRVGDRKIRLDERLSGKVVEKGDDQKVINAIEDRGKLRA